MVKLRHLRSVALTFFFFTFFSTPVSPNMSRHRAVRNLDIDDVLDEDQYEDNYDENQLDESQLTNEDHEQLDNGLQYVYSVLGDDIPLSDVEIKEALWYYYFDKEETVDWALGKIQQIKKEQEKKQAQEQQKKQAAAKAKAAATAKSKSNDLSSNMAKLALGNQKTKSSTSVSSASNLSTPSTTPIGSRAPSPLAKIPASKRINVLEEYAKRTNEKPKMNLVVIGHVDAGKSTLMGHVLYALGHVNERTMQKYEHDSQKIGKGSFSYAWVLDETGEERDRGITMDIAMNHFDTPHRQFTLLDAPGHRDFIPNMISGTAQADAAILVVDAATGGFESGFQGNGQTKEHAYLARSLGVQQLVVAINKLDAVEWSQSRYDEIVAQLKPFLLQVGFRGSKMTFVPVSGLTGANLVKRSDDKLLTSWYDGPCLVEIIDVLEPPVRVIDKPLRITVTDFFKGGVSVGSSSGVSIGGSIDAGHVQVGEHIMIVPGNEVGIVKTLQVNDEAGDWAAAGDSVLMTIQGLDILNFSTGCVACNPQFPVPVTRSFTAQIVVFDIRYPLTSGMIVNLHQQGVDEPVVISKLKCILDKSTGEVLKKKPRHLLKGMTAKVQIDVLDRPIPLEAFKDSKHLGRITLRKYGETMAAGVVDEILTFGA
ncbi:P-loop containing nucleoside triphosphate hydrolase protein [Gongronella butleri]|nr:P-loop containing nucleoside triphosphate hydrolase protein [Gongronella butleri]